LSSPPAHCPRKSDPCQDPPCIFFPLFNFTSFYFVVCPSPFQVYKCRVFSLQDFLTFPLVSLFENTFGSWDHFFYSYSFFFPPFFCFFLLFSLFDFSLWLFRSISRPLPLLRRVTPLSFDFAGTYPLFSSCCQRFFLMMNFLCPSCLGSKL